MAACHCSLAPVAPCPSDENWITELFRLGSLKIINVYILETYVTKLESTEKQEFLIYPSYLHFLCHLIKIKKVLKMMKER